MWHALVQTVAKVLVIPTVWIMSLAGYYVPTEQTALPPQVQAAMQQYLTQSEGSPLFGATQPFAGSTYNLAGSGVSSSATTLILTSLTIRQTGQLIQTTDLVGAGGTFYITLEPGSNTRQEIVGCTGITQAASSASLTGCTRGLSPLYPYTASSSLQFVHGGGTQVIFSDPPQLFNQFAAVANTEAITGLYSFDAVLPTSVMIATTGPQFVTKALLDATARAGVATSTETNGGQVRLGTLAEQASTYNGGANDPAALQTKNSTSTCQVVGSYNIVASTTTGKLDKGCFDQNGIYSLASTTIGIFQATNATTTASLYVRGKFNLQTTSASSSVLGVDANGFVTANPAVNVQYILATSTAIVASNSAPATSTSMVIPAGAINASSTIQTDASVACTNNGSGVGKICTFFLRYCTTGQPLASITLGTQDSVSGTDQYLIHINTFATSSTQAQVSYLGDTNYQSSSLWGQDHSTTYTSYNMSSAFSLCANLTTNDGTMTETLNSLSIIVRP